MIKSNQEKAMWNKQNFKRIFALCCMAALFLAGCSAAGSGENTENVFSYETDVSLSVDECIDDKYVVQIPEFSAVPESSTIDDMNSDIDSLLVSMYEADMDTGDKIPEIKTEIYESEKYLQAVVMYVEYPLLGSDGDVISYNYQRDDNRRLTMSDALIMSDTTLDDLKNIIIDRYYSMEPSSDMDVFNTELAAVYGITVDGFIIKEDGSIDFYGNIDISINGDEPWSYIFKYNAQTDELEFSLEVI